MSPSTPQSFSFLIDFAGAPVQRKLALARLSHSIAASTFGEGSPKRGAEMAVIGYASVSTRDQDLTGQIEALKAAGAKTISANRVMVRK